METKGFGEEIIHMIPLGHEIDRAVKPFEKYKANKVYLLALNETFGRYEKEMIEKQQYYTEAVKAIIESYGIPVQSLNVDLFDTLEVAKHLSRIIVEEKAKKNQVFVNMSSGNKLSSVVSTLTAMAHKAKAYYVVADGYTETEADKKKHGISFCNRLELRWIENLPLKLPSDNELKVLVSLCLEKSGCMNTTKILQSLGTQKVKGYEKCTEMFTRKMSRGEKTNCLMKLNKGILSKLESEGYVSREKQGKYNLIKIEPKGVFVAHISGQMK
ncbi:MAG: DUF6293 family protein [Candidatus Bathyarchaeia archaeon]